MRQEEEEDKLFLQSSTLFHSHTKIFSNIKAISTIRSLRTFGGRTISGRKQDVAGVTEALARDDPGADGLRRRLFFFDLHDHLAG